MFERYCSCNERQPSPTLTACYFCGKQLQKLAEVMNEPSPAPMPGLWNVPDDDDFGNY